MKFRLLVGKHQGRDHTVKKPEDAPDNWCPPVKDYTAGQTVQSDVDLVALHGKDKFERIVPRSRKMEEEEEQEADFKAMPAKKQRMAAVAPGGQVSTGKQVATSTKDGRTISGPELDEDDEEMAEEMAARTGRHPKEFKKTSSKKSSEEDQEELDSKLQGMTKGELLSYAKDHDIEVTTSMTKSDLIAAISTSNDAGQPVDDEDEDEDEDE